jgi:hypothetical protein
MRRVIYAILVFLTILPAAVSGQSTIYRLCKNSNTSHDICRSDGTGEFKGHERIISYRGKERFEAYFYPDRQFSVFRYFSNNNRVSIDVANNGLVGRNLDAGEYFPNNKNYNNTLPEIRAMFLGSPDWRRKAIQRNLKRLDLYNSTIDGLWGRNTFNAIIGYNAVFKQTLQVGNNYKADQLLNAISSHKRFNYADGKLTKTQPTSGCVYTTSNRSVCSSTQVCKWATNTKTPKSWNNASVYSRGWVAEAKRRNMTCGVSEQPKTCTFKSKNRSSCSPNNVCQWATVGAPKRWNNYNSTSKSWVAEAKRRGLSCGVNEQSKNVCAYNKTDGCTNTAICSYATIGNPKRWNHALGGGNWMREAKKRNLKCGVIENIASAPSNNNCSNDPTKCGAVELCQKAVETKSGKVFWRTDVYGKRYAAAAKSIGLSCNVDSENPEKTYRVANGTGFFVTESGDVVTNQHVISGCNEVQVHSGGEMAAATVVSQDKINDLALLRTKLKTKSTFSLAPENPYLLQDIIAAGFPFGESVSSTIKVTKGVVSSLSGLGDNSGQIQIDAALQPGNSGGPIIDENGNVVGVAVAKLDLEKSIESFGVVPENVNFGIKLSSLKTFLDDNNVDYTVGNEREIKNSALGKLATEATVLLSCWMTEARIETMQNSKAMFKEILKK